jgi:hypothetical protein
MSSFHAAHRHEVIVEALQSSGMVEVAALAVPFACCGLDFVLDQVPRLSLAPDRGAQGSRPRRNIEVINAPHFR